MKWKTGKTNEWSSRFAWWPTRMTKGSDDHDAVVWLEVYWTRTESYHGMLTWERISDDDYRAARARQWAREVKYGQL